MTIRKGKKCTFQVLILRRTRMVRRQFCSSRQARSFDVLADIIRPLISAPISAQLTSLSQFWIIHHSAHPI